MNTADLLHLLAYRVWARKRVLAAAGAADINQAVVSSFASIRETLVHVLSADVAWATRLKGGAAIKHLNHEEFPALADLVARWEAVDEDLRAATAEPEAIIAYRTMAGDPYRQSVAQIIQHVVNHQTYHFGQIATLLRQLGAAAPAIDLCVYDRTAVDE